MLTDVQLLLASLLISDCCWHAYSYAIALGMHSVMQLLLACLLNALALGATYGVQMKLLWQAQCLAGVSLLKPDHVGM